MEQTLAQSFAQFDKQMIERRQQLAWINLNNLYLQVERGDVKMSVTVMNNLYTLAGIAYPTNEDVMRNYWEAEFQKLPNWLAF